MINRRTFNTLAMTSLAGAGLLGLSACGGSGSGSDSKTFVIWDYESDDSAMGQAWARAPSRPASSSGAPAHRHPPLLPVRTTPPGPARPPSGWSSW